MDQVIVVTLTLLLLSGFSQGQNLLPPGPVNGVVQGSVYFATIQPPQEIDSINWRHEDRDVITFTPSDSEKIHPNYVGRVNLNRTNGALRLTQLKLTDTGEYTVTLSSGGEEIQDHISLQVFEPVVGAAISSSGGILIENQSTVNLTCDGNGTIITTEWMREDQILLPNSHIMFINNNRSVIISPVRREDNGQYRCTISNPVSNDTAEHKMTINYGPDVNILGIKTLEEGTDILLFCSTDSVPPATVAWTVNDMNAGSTPLYIKETSSPSHSGNYICTAWNNLTNILHSAVHVLTVKPKSFELSPGAAAGTAVGVILGVETMAVLLYFLIMYLKKPADTAINLKQTDQQTKPSQDGEETDEYENLETDQEAIPDRTETPSPSVYENNGPALPPRKLPNLPTRVKPSNSNLYCSTLN